MVWVKSILKELKIFWGRNCIKVTILNNTSYTELMYVSHNAKEGKIIIIADTWALPVYRIDL